MIRCLASVPGWFSAPIENSVHFRRIWFVVDYAAIDLDPGVGFEGYLPRADDHLSGDAVLLQKARCGRRPLQTESLFPIPDRRHVHCRTDRLERIRRCRLPTDWIVAHLVVQCGKIS